MTFGRRPHERILAFARIHRIHLRVMRQKKFDSGHGAGSRGDHQSGLAVPASGIGIRARGQQLLD